MMDALIIFLAGLLSLVNAQSSVIFPVENDEQPGKIPPRLSDDRIPVHIPGKCPPNQLLYPGDQKHDWICDCGPGFIYLPSKDGCFAAYRKGPCADNEILILPQGTVIPECTANPCKTDGFVQYQGKCYELDKSGGPCKAASEGGGIFGVNKITLELECLKNSQLLNIINFPSNCPPGSRRSASHCRPEY